MQFAMYGHTTMPAVQQGFGGCYGAERGGGEGHTREGGGRVEDGRAVR